MADNLSPTFSDLTPSGSPLPAPGMSLARRIVEHAPIPIMVLDATDDRLFYVNSAAVKAIGKIPLPVEAEQKCYEYAFGSDHVCEHCPRRHLSDREMTRTFFKTSGLDGRTYALHTTIADWNGIPATVCYVTQLTEGDTEYAELVETSEKIPAGIGVYRVTGDRIERVYVNRRLAAFIGNDTDGLPSDELFNVFAEEERRKFVQAVLDFAHGKDSGELHRTVHARGKDGVLKAYTCLGSVVKNKDKSPVVRLLFTSGEIPAEPPTKDDLLTHIFEVAGTSGSLFWLLDIDTRELRLLGGEVSGRPPYVMPQIYKNVPESLVATGFVHHTDVSAFINAYQKIYDGEKSVEWDMSIRFLKDISTFMPVHCKLLRYTDKKTGRAMAVGFLFKTETGNYLRGPSSVPDCPARAHVVALEYGRVVLKKYDPAFARVLGYPGGKFPEETENDLGSIVHPEDRHRYVAFIESVMTGKGKADGLDYRIVCSDKTVYSVHDSSISVNDRDFGHVIYSDLAITDLVGSDNHSAPGVDTRTLTSVLMHLSSCIISLNVTANRYRFLDVTEHARIAVAAEGTIDDFVAGSLACVPEPDNKEYAASFGRQALLDAYHAGKKTISLEHIWTAGGITKRILSQVVFYKMTGSDDVCAIALSRDVTEDYKARIALQTDGLSGLAYRTVFEHMVDYRLEQNEGEKCCITIVDMDNLKLINDSGGHAAGDRAIEHIAQAIRETMPQGTILGRLGGDEFGIFMCPSPNKDEVTRMLESMQNKFKSYQIEKLDNMPLTCSVGSFVTTARKDTKKEILARADAALYAVKFTGKNSLCVVEED